MEQAKPSINERRYRHYRRRSRDSPASHACRLSIGDGTNMPTHIPQILLIARTACADAQDAQFGFAVTIITLGGLCGSLAADWVIRRYGRNTTLRMAQVGLVLGGMGVGVAQGIWTLAVGRYVLFPRWHFPPRPVGVGKAAQRLITRFCYGAFCGSSGPSNLALHHGIHR